MPEETAPSRRGPVWYWRSRRKVTDCQLLLLNLDCARKLYNKFGMSLSSWAGAGLAFEKARCVCCGVGTTTQCNAAPRIPEGVRFCDGTRRGLGHPLVRPQRYCAYMLGSVEKASVSMDQGCLVFGYHNTKAADLVMPCVQALWPCDNNGLSQMRVGFGMFRVLRAQGNGEHNCDCDVHVFIHVDVAPHDLGNDGVVVEQMVSESVVLKGG